MSIVDLFVDRRPRVANIVIDATLSEEHGRTAEESVYPVEDGADRSDHRKLNPRTVSIVGLVSAVQWNPNYAVRDFIAGSESLDLFRHRTAWQELNKLFEKDEDVLLSTDLETYSRMAIISLTATRAPREIEVLRFSATFRERLVAYTTFVAAAAAEVEDLAAEAAEAGGKQTVESSEAEALSAAELVEALGLLG